MTRNVLILLILLVSGGRSCVASGVAAYGQAAVDQISTLQNVVAARLNYFVPATNAAIAAQCLADVQTNLQLFINDSQYAEVAWFLEQIAKIIGTVGNDVAVGNDISGKLYEFRQWADPVNTFSTRVWSTTFCVAVMQRIFSQLSQALQLIPPLTTVFPPRSPQTRAMEFSRSPSESLWTREATDSLVNKITLPRKIAFLGCLFIAFGVTGLGMYYWGMSSNKEGS